MVHLILYILMDQLVQMILHQVDYFQYIGQKNFYQKKVL